jgi:hypothetical protein
MQTLFASGSLVNGDRTPTPVIRDRREGKSAATLVTWDDTAAPRRP